MNSNLQSLCNGLNFEELPNHPGFDNSIPHAPSRDPGLTLLEEKQAIKNALRYFPSKFHEILAKEFLEELKQFGHIYMYRFRPISYEMKAYNCNQYPGQCVQAKAMMMMIMNNLDKDIAQYPHELITYGGNGSVFQNWAQYLLTMQYLTLLNEESTLIMNSGHPQGIFPSSRNGPRCVISNGNVIPNYSSRELYEKYFAIGNTMYGEMTAGSYCYIGPQGIVHGTTLTLLNAGRKYLNTESLAGVVYVTSGLGGMSGAQAKAGEIAGCISVIAEINEAALDKRHKQGWLKEKFVDLSTLMTRIAEAKAKKEGTSLGYLGNIVDLWERLAEENITIELGSDQTSLHNPYGGGYYPVGISLEEATSLLKSDSKKFDSLVKASLVRHVSAVNKMVAKGMRFWDYGNSFLLEAGRAGADIFSCEATKTFKYPTYFEEMMDDIFALGFGPFRWICASCSEADLHKTDEIAAQVIAELMKVAPSPVALQYKDNLKWIKEADSHKLVVGSKARILYADTQARVLISQKFNEAIANGVISGPIVLSRDHHDVSGTDSPFRETSALKDGSRFTADMAIQNVIGDSFRGATWVSLHNGGGVGWGEVVNGGFGHILDGSSEAGLKASSMLSWDVNNGVTRRAWSGNPLAVLNIQRQMELDPSMKVTIPVFADQSLIDSIFQSN